MIEIDNDQPGGPSPECSGAGEPAEEESVPPDISPARAALIRERIASGYYNDPLVVEALARKLLDRGVL
jgi:hypothetical protein